MPILSGMEMTQRIFVIMSGNFGISGGAGSDEIMLPIAFEMRRRFTRKGNALRMVENRVVNAGDVDEIISNLLSKYQG